MAIAIANALKDAGHQVLVADEQWSNIRRARMAGLPVFFGNAVSGYAEERLDLSGIGMLLAASRRPDLNELACVRFAKDFGRACVFTLENNTEAGHQKFQVAGALRGTVLFHGEHTVDSLMSLIREGAEARSTKITEEFSVDDYRNAQSDAVILFVTGPDGRVRFSVDDADQAFAAGSTITALVPADEPRDARVPGHRGELPA